MSTPDPVRSALRRARLPGSIVAPGLELLAGLLGSAANGLRVLELATRVKQLEVELSTATVTAQATGILMALHSCDAERATALLWNGAARAGTSVETEAAVVVDRAERRPSDPVPIRSRAVRN